MQKRGRSNIKLGRGGEISRRSFAAVGVDPTVVEMFVGTSMAAVAAYGYLSCFDKKNPNFKFSKFPKFPGNSHHVDSDWCV